jgi:hypothetical protein
MNTFCKRLLAFAAVFVFLGVAARSEQPHKAAQPAVEERIKKLEERAEAAEKMAAAAAMEKDYIGRTQKLYESYYQKTFSMQLWTLGIVGVLLIGVFGLVARFSLNLFEQRTKLAITDASVQLRNEYTRTLAKEVQKLWESNAADNRKLKDALNAQTAELVENLKDRSDFQMHFVHGLTASAEERHNDTVEAFRQALAAYKSGKPRHLLDTKIGASVARYSFESLRKKHGENAVEKAREELSDALYNGLEEELALAALQSPWLLPLVNERNPAPPEPASSEPAAAEVRPATPLAVSLQTEADLAWDEASDSCRLISS